MDRTLAVVHCFTLEVYVKITYRGFERRIARIGLEARTRLFPLRKSAATGPTLSYACQAPHAGEIATGGRVKLIALSSRFPETRQANLLYLVSSALPSNYRYWVERARKEGIPIVLNQNGVATPGWAGEMTEATNAPLRWVLERAHTVMYQSEFCRRSADRFLGPASGDVRIAYNAVDLEKFSPAESIPARPLTLLLGGSQYQKYRVSSALAAFAHVLREVPDALLLVSGKVDWQSDPRRSMKEALEIADHLGVRDHVKFTGPFLQSEAPALYRQADLLLHTKYNDPCPTAVIEALACGLGVVHSKSGGLPELVDSESGFAIPVPESYLEDHEPTAEEWAGAILQCAKRLPEIRVHARQRAVERFGLDQWLQLHQFVFESIVSHVES